MTQSEEEIRILEQITPLRVRLSISEYYVIFSKRNKTMWYSRNWHNCNLHWIGMTFRNNFIENINCNWSIVSEQKARQQHLGKTKITGFSTKVQLQEILNLF